MYKRLILCLLLGLAAALPAAAAQDCPRAERLFRRARPADAVQAERILKQVLALCPRYAPALNDLAVLREEQGRYAEAERLYRRALQARPGFLPALAGLGDLALRRGDHLRAVEFYRRFLDGLERRRQGYFQPGGGLEKIARHEAEYRRKYELARLRAGILRDSVRGTVGREYLLRGLSTRGVGGVRPRLALQIRFAYDSARLTPAGRRQLREMARALQDPALKRCVVLIEGHTDTFGSEQYNLRLSRRRAQAVRDFLVSCGVAAERLRVRGLGESRPLVPEGDKEAQAPNRRVEFVNLGPAG